MPFEVPTGWCWCKLDDIAQSNIGLTYKPADVTTDGTPVLRSNNIQNNKLCLDDVVRVSTEIRANQFISKGDLLICARNGSRRLVGKCALINSLDEQCSFGAFMAVCKSLYNEWLFYVLCSTYFSQYLDDSNSTTIYQVTQKMLLDLPVPFPPLKEQKRIATEIEKYINLIDLLEESKHDLDLTIFHVKSKILDLAIHGKLVPQDANDEPASELQKRINPKAVSSCDNPHYENVPYEIPSTWAWVKLGDITNYGKCSTCSVDDIGNNSWILELEDIEKNTGRVLVKHTKAERDIKGVRHSFFEGNVLYSKLRTYLNKVLLANEDGFCTTEIIPIECTDAVYSQYLCYVLRSQYFLDYTIQCGYGVKMPRLSTSDARKASIPLPPYKEQVKISRKVNELMKALDSIAETLG